MGILNKVFKMDKSKNTFHPDFNKTDYDNWLSFLELGGTSEEWERLKLEGRWKFKDDGLDAVLDYEQVFRPLFAQYSESAQLIKSAWSAIYNSKCYTGEKAEQFEKDCIENINDYKMIYMFEEKYQKNHMTSAEGYKRLAMLYEKRGRLEEAAEVCIEACSLGLNEKSRLERINKKINK